MTSTFQLKAIVKDYGGISFSAILTAMAVNFFFASTTLAPGGITGLSIIFATITHIPVSIMTLCISIPLFILATIFLGKNFGIKTLYITLLTPICMQLIPFMDITSLPLPSNIILLIASIAGSLLVGTAIGIALRHDCATGGTDVIALLIQKMLKNVKLSTIMFCLDGSVVIASGIITGNILISIFSLFSLYIIVHTISFITNRRK